jgi:hypothetical protein
MVVRAKRLRGQHIKGYPTLKIEIIDPQGNISTRVYYELQFRTVTSNRGIRFIPRGTHYAYGTYGLYRIARKNRIEIDYGISKDQFLQRAKRFFERFFEVKTELGYSVNLEICGVIQHWEK